MRWTLDLVRTVSVLALWSVGCAADEAIRTLIPDVPLYSLKLHHGRTLDFQLENISYDHLYEVRVSYPSTIPTDFVLKISTDDPSKWTKRKLLNVEKLIFQPKSISTDKSQLFLSVTAWRTGVVTDRALLDQPAVFNLNLDTLYFGLPHHVWRAAVVMLIGLLVCLVFIVPWLYRYLLYTVQSLPGDERPHQQ